MAQQKRIGLITVLTFCFVVSFCVDGNCQRQVVEFPGAAAGEAQGEINGNQIRLENSVVACLWTVSGGRLLPVVFSDKISSKAVDLNGSEWF